MIDTKELRRLAQAAQGSPRNIHERVNAIHNLHDALPSGVVLEILDRLEAAEKECESWKGLAKQFGNEADVCATHLYFAKDELNRLRARIEEMERQEPVAQVGVHKTGGNAGIAWSARPLNEFDSLPPLCDGDKLYLAPGAQPAQKEVAYLDLGTGGYMDIGTDLSDEQLASLPKGRHMLGIVGTYGVDGYVSAQPAPSIPDCPYPCGWRNLLSLAIKDGAYLAVSINEDEPVTENARNVAMRMVMQLRDVLMAINAAAPTPEAKS